MHMGIGKVMAITLGEIESALQKSGMAPSRFGRMALNDPRLVFDLRRGRRLGADNARRVQGCLQQLAGGAAQVQVER